MKKNKYDTFLILKKLKKNKLLNNLNTLSIEKDKIQLVKETLHDMINASNIDNFEETLGSNLKVRANFRQNLMNKLEISSNRQNHLQNEINNNLSAIGKIEKQKEKILEKKKIEEEKKQNLIELKKENYFKPKNLIPFQEWHYNCRIVSKKGSYGCNK